jgi:hypothetical protein
VFFSKLSKCINDHQEKVGETQQVVTDRGILSLEFRGRRHVIMLLIRQLPVAIATDVVDDNYLDRVTTTILAG